MDTSKTAETVKKFGYKSLKQLSEITGIQTQTLRKWAADRPRLFIIILSGAVQYRTAPVDISKIEQVRGNS
jgi:hypothetical protein